MIPQTLFNTNMFIAGQSLQGDVTSLSLPKVTRKTEEFRGGGMDASVAMDVGLEKLEASFAMSGVRREALKYVGAFDQNGFDASFRGAFKGLRGAVTGVVATLRGGLREVDPGEWSAGSKAEFKYIVDVTYYKLEIDGRVMFEIDPINSVRVIDGVDQLADVRNVLGL